MDSPWVSRDYTDPTRHTLMAAAVTADSSYEGSRAAGVALDYDYGSDPPRDPRIYPVGGAGVDVGGGGADSGYGSQVEWRVPGPVVELREGAYSHGMDYGRVTVW
jgi:hypothetical protein